MAPTEKQVMDAAVREDKFLASMRRRHKTRLVKTIRGLEDKMIRLMKDIEVSKSGKVMGTRVNLKQTQAIHKQMLNLFAIEYGDEVKGLIDEFDSISKHIQRSWRDLGESVKFTGVDRDMFRTLKGQTFSEYEAFGTAAQNRIAKAMYSAMTGATAYSDLLKTVQGALTGHKDVAGRSMLTYADQHTFDSVMNFQNEVNVKKAEDLGFDHFLYVGDIISTSRQFCIRRAGKVYSKKEIESWNKRKWSGKSGPPMSNRGGYRCRHHWRAVRPEWFPEGEVDVGNYFDDFDEAHFTKIKSTDSPEIVEIKQRINQEIKLKSGFRKRRLEIRARQRVIKAGKITPKLEGELKDLRKEFKDLQVSSTVSRKKIAELEGILKKGVTETKLEPSIPISVPISEKTIGPGPIWIGIKNSKEIPSGLKSFGINNIGIKNMKLDKGIGWVNYYGKNLESVYNRFPGLVESAKDRLLFDLIIENKSFVGRKGTRGIHSRFNHKINMAIKGISQKDSLNLGSGGWFVGSDAGSLFRHEFGHHIWYDVLSDTQKSEFVRLARSRNLKEWKNIVSEYASTNGRELFAESFSAYTSPIYSASNKKLPDEIVNFFKSIFGES